MKLLLSSIILIVLCSNAQAQPHTLGIRGGLSSGLSASIWLDDWHAAAALLSFRNNGMQFTVMKQQYQAFPLPWFPETKLFTGWGVHLGYARSPNTPYNWDYDYYYDMRSGPLVGGDFIIGLAWDLNKLPLSISIDAKPFAEFSTIRMFRLNLWDFGMGIQYRFS